VKAAPLEVAVTGPGGRQLKLDPVSDRGGDQRACRRSGQFPICRLVSNSVLWLPIEQRVDSALGGEQLRVAGHAHRVRFGEVRSAECVPMAAPAA
jgi:hypothetical protein